MVLASGTGACVSPDDADAVVASAEPIDRSTQALGTGTLLWANGTYGAGCLTHSGSWSLRISGAAAMDNAALSVVKNNTACVLTLTSLVADQTYAATPSIAMGSSYAGSASAFAPSGAVNFYANAKLSATTFSSDFVVTILYSDDKRAATGALTAGYASVAATSTATSQTSPNYTLDMATDALAVQTDANYIVTAATGLADLTDGSTTGDGYIVDLGTLATTPTFAQLDAAYTAGSPTTISGANPQITAATFGLVGVDLTTAAVRTIVIRKSVSGVRSFQTFKITFSHP
jgi:hypothetical protein